MTRLLYPSKALEEWVEVDVFAISDEEGRRYTAKDVEKIEKDIEDHIKTEASTEQHGHVKLNDTLTSNSKTEAATADSIRRVSVKVDNAVPKDHKHSAADITSGVMNDARLPSASTSRKGIVQLDDSISSTSSSRAATPWAVKRAYDKALEAMSSSDLKERVDYIYRHAEPGYTGIGGGVALGGGSVNTGGMSIAIGDLARCEAQNSITIGVIQKTLNTHEGTLGGTMIGEWKVRNNFSVQGTKNFEIPHPAPHKRDTHVIRHGAVESPTPGDTLYRYFVKFKDKIAQIALCGSDSLIETSTTPLGGGGGGGVKAKIPLPDYWTALNKDAQVVVNGHMHFGAGYGYVDEENEELVLVFQEEKDYHVILYGTRNDEDVQKWYIKGVEREVGESWLGESYVFEDDEIITEEEFIDVEEEI